MKQKYLLSIFQIQIVKMKIVHSKILMKRNQINPRRICLWSQYDSWRIKWDIYIMLLATISWFLVPYNIAFQNEFDNTIYSDLFEAVGNFCFIFDIFISFRTTYVDDSTQDEVTDWKKIAKQYLKGRFWIDFLASIPFDYVTYLYQGSNTFFLDFFKLLKLFRVLRLSKLVAYMNIKNEIKNSIRLIKLIFFLLLFLHWLGWSWFFIIKQNQDWIPPLDSYSGDDVIYNRGNYYQYFEMFYYALLILGGNDISPKGLFQIIFTIFMLIICSIVNAIILGNFTVMLTSLNRKSSRFQEKLENVTDVMKKS